MADFIHDHHIVAGLYPVADCFAGGKSTDIINMENYGRATFVILTGAIEDSGISNIFTVDACDDASASNTSAMAFTHRTCLSSATVDTWGAQTAAAATGYNLTDNAAVANAMHIVEVNAEDVSADGGNGYGFVRLTIAETANKTITAAVICILSDPRYPQEVPVSAIA